MPPADAAATDHKAIYVAKSSPADLKDKLTIAVTITTCGHGEEAKTVVLHVEVLRDGAPGLYDRVKASASGELKLLHLDANAFGTFAGRVYTRRIDLMPSHEESNIIPAVLECYTLACELKATDFGNDVLSHACAVVKKHGLAIGDADINEVYARTARGSKLREWLVDQWAWLVVLHNPKHMIWEDRKEVVGEFFFDVLTARALRPGYGKENQSPNSQPEKYHEPKQATIAVG